MKKFAIITLSLALFLALTGVAGALTMDTDCGQEINTCDSGPNCLSDDQPFSRVQDRDTERTWETERTQDMEHSQDMECIKDMACTKDSGCTNDNDQPGETFHHDQNDYDDGHDHHYCFQDNCDHQTGNNAPVPEPATMLLLGTGLVGMIGAKRKRFLKK